MTYNHIKMLNIVRTDSLLRLADSPNVIRHYIQKYHSVDITEEQSISLHKGARTIQEKIETKRRADKQLVAA